MSALCVECDAELNLSPRARIGQRIVCPNCGVQLEVISTHPLEVDVAIDDGEEWDDLDGYSLDDDALDDDELDDDELEDVGRINGAGASLEDELEDELEEWDEDLEGDDLEGELEDELEDELDGELDGWEDERGAAAGKV